MLLAQILLNGILLGGLYGLMALGMGLVWGVLNIVNLAHGALIMLGGYAVYFLYTGAGIDPYLALLLFSADFRTINPPYAGNNTEIGPVTIPHAQLFAFLVALFLAALLFL